MALGDWKHKIVQLIEARDLIQTKDFDSIIQDYSSAREQLGRIIAQYDRIDRELQSYKQENADLTFKLQKSNALKSYDFEKKVFHLQEEVTELHRQKGQLAGDVIELNKVVQEKEKAVIWHRGKLKESESKAADLLEMNIKLQSRLHSMEQASEMLREESSKATNALKDAHTRNRELEEDRTKLIDKLSKQQKTIEKLKNIEHDINYMRAQEAIRKQLAEAASAPVDEPELEGPPIRNSVVPRRILAEITANEGEVNSVHFTPSGHLFGSAGFDRKLRLWAVVDDKCELRTTLVGCNQSITAIDFDPLETVVIGASSDFSCRVWTLNDSRLRVNLTGHSERVVAAKFMGSAKRAVTVSSDRTIKLWDVDRSQCKRTIMTPSTAQDVVACTAFGVVVTGHFDHHLRVWDERAESSAETIKLSGRVTGLDISADCTQILAATRANTLEVVNLRMKKVVQRLTCPGFCVGLDYVRPTLSPDTQYAACGAQDHSVYIWNVITGQLERSLTGHSNVVVCTHWNPKGHSLVSCERLHKAIVWSDT